ncbi:MAG: AMP-binding protein [Acidobacteriaceae bacterium]
MRPHLASLVDDLRRNERQTAIVRHRGVRRHATTYAALATLAGRFSAELARRNIASGERVVFWAENSAEWVAAFFGCILRGVLPVPLDAAGPPDFAARVIADVNPRLILADTPRIASLTANVPHLSLENIALHLPTQPLFIVDPSVTLDAPFQIIFTSGTTGTPKGIVHTHRNVLASLDPIEREMQKYLRYERLVHPLRFLHTLPLSHVFGQFMGLWTPPLLGAEVHFENQFEPARMLDRIRVNRISVLVAVPRSLELLRAHLQLRYPGLEAELAASEGWPVYKRMVHFRRIHRLTGWKFWALISGGATLAPELELFWGRLGYAVIQGYGMTETAALITLNHPFHVGRGTLGKPLPGREVRISPEGEIMVRGDVVSGSNWANGAIQPRSSEWLATGDLATQDASGDLRFSGRRGDVIVTAAGLNIYPADLEAALLKQHGVRAAAVVCYEGVNGPEPVAVLLAEGDTAQMGEMVEEANRSLADFQQIRHVLRWPEPSFPFTSTGKLLRRVVAGWACEQLTVTAHPASTRGDTLLQMISSVTGESPAMTTDAARLSEDLHLDSLGRVQMQSLLEQRYGVELEDEQIAQSTTLGDLRALVGSPTIPAPHSPLELISPPAAPLSPLQPTTGAAAPTTQPPERRPSSDLIAHRYLRWPWLSAVNVLRVGFQELILRPLVWLLAAPNVERHDVPEPRPPLLIISNHITAYDVPLILYGLPPDIRHRVAVAMSGEMLFDFRRGRGAANAFLNALLPIAYWLITLLINVFPLPRLGGFRRSFEHAGRALDRGYSVLIFPEGHRSDGGTLQAFRPGIGLLTQQAAADVLPVTLVGMDQIIQSGRRWFRSGRIIVRIGETIPFDPLSTPERTTRRLHAAIAELMG